MALHKLLLPTILMIFASCNGQETTNTIQGPITVHSSPTVVKGFKTVGLAPDFDTTLVSQYIRSIFQDSKGNLWFGSIADGVIKYDTKTLTYFSHPDGFVNNTVYAINEDNNGNMWFGTDQGVYKYNGNHFKNYNLKDGLQHINISRKSILVDKTGKIWVGTHAGVYQYDSSADANGSPAFSLFPLLGTINVAGIMQEKSGNIWFASSDKGVYRYDGKAIVHYNEQEGLGENYAGGMAQDPMGNLWFTMKNGICKFDGNNFTYYTAKDGLGGTEFWGILIEQSGVVWITARGSTTRFDPSIHLSTHHAFRVFTAADGFTCCVQSMFQDKSGNMWWGTGQGLYRFNGNRFYQVKRVGPW